MLKKLLYSEDYVATGLLLLRIGIGIAFVLHGFPKVFGGHAEGLAGALTKAGIPGGIVAAYLAGMAEFFGGLALIAGVLFRPATVVMAFTMLVALTFHLSFGDPFDKFSHALESLVLFIALTITGPGRFSLDYRWFCASNKKECSPRSYGRSIPATSV
jgi:putative oxidoreductase